MRRRIVDAAFEAFAREGYNATPMHAVRDLAGVSSGAFAHHFPTKHGLGMAVIRERVAEAIGRTWIEPLVRAADARSGIRSVFDTTIAEIDDSGSVSGCPLGNLAAELSTQGEGFRAEIHRIFRQWGDAIADKLAADGCPEEDRAGMASFVVSSFSGAMLQAKACQSSDPLRSSAAQVERIMRGPEAERNRSARQ